MEAYENKNANKKIINKIFTFVLSLIITISLVGCGEASIDYEGSHRVPEVVADKDAENDKERMEDTSFDLIADETGDAISVTAYANYWIKTYDGEYLSCKEGKITTSNNPYLWMFEPIQIVDYAGSYKVNVAENDEYKNQMFDINNAWYVDDNSVGIHGYTGYSAQYWRLAEAIVEGEKGVLFVSAENPEFVLHRGNDGFVITTADKLTKDDLYTLTLVEDSESNTLLSEDGIMQFIYEKRLLEVISEQRLQLWLNNYEKAYYAFVKLQGSAPFEKVYIFDTENDENYWAAYCGNGVIRMVPDCAYEEFAIIASKDTDDVSFGMLHELGHLFDDSKPWVFEPEAMTDIKIPYILKMTGFNGAPAEYGDSKVFTGDNISECYKERGTSLEQEYGAYEMAYKMSTIYDEVGYDVLQKVLQNFPDTNGMSSYEKFETWLEINTKYSGEDIKAKFSEKELENIQKALD